MENQITLKRTLTLPIEVLCGLKGTSDQPVYLMDLGDNPIFVA